MDKEPAVVLGAITAVAAALLAALVAFGLDISDAKQSAILGIIAAVTPLVLGLVTRGQVFAPANVAAAVTPGGRTLAGPASNVVDGRPVEVTPTGM